MSTQSADVVAPVPEAADDLARVLSFLEAHETKHGHQPEPRFFLAGANEHDRVELTEQLHDVLLMAARALHQGQSVSILARDQEITTQQAAELLGLSRPTVVRLINNGELVATVPGSVRRKLRLADVLDYRSQLYRRRTAFIADSAEGYDEVDVSDLLDAARRQRK